MEKDIRRLMEKYNIRPSKSWGQNFLVSKEVKAKITEASAVQKDDLVIEIGAGLGVLSKELAAKAGRLVAIEIDKHLVSALEGILKDYKNVVIINKDVLKLDIKNDIIRKVCGTAHEANGITKGDVFIPACIKVVGNLPYYITTPIIMKLLEEEPGIDEIIFMVQKEVADRILAKPGTKDYGSLSIAVQYYSQPEILFDVPPFCFLPRPKVYSSVIRLIINKIPPVHVVDKDLFFKIVRASFGQRRKTLLNALFNANIFSLSKEEIKSILKSLEINENMRGENLSLIQFAQMSNVISRKLNTLNI
ncbi:MAG: 16S rRNA (adenine(1518)-N(6)/adenine(1519)-N(6))-dimethyltransferase RsmA [Firmicutes bacterium]|nr:16S rRNA (adenine(1518)-N(6)/adenine(1519)-N(6))-dimethyltransferase RsmA [Bacillota bacterium]